MAHSRGTQIQNHALRRLAHLMAGGENQHTLDSAHDFLIEQALLERGKEKSVKEIREGITSLFLLRFSNEEVKDSIDRLIREGKVIEKKSHYTLEVEREGALRKINSDTKAQEKKIYADWLEKIARKYSTLPTDDKEILRKDLQEYLNKIFLQHGAECSILIYPEKSNPTFIAGISGGEIDKILLARAPQISEIRQVEFPAFLQDIDSEKRQYFSRLLDGTFIYNIVQADSSVIHALREQLSNYVFYLDTNVIYAVLELHSPKKASTMEKAFNIGKTFGINFVVSSRTIEEMQKSIELKSKELMSTPDIRQDLAEESADISEEENFVTSYLRSYARTGITKEDFIAKLQHIPELLKAKGISIIQDPYKINPTELEIERAQLKAAVPRKTLSIAEHDAYHKILIKKEREAATARVPEQKYWFLSFDSPLSQYALTVRRGGDTPFVYMPHQLLQVLRIFEQRTQDFDATFMELFARPQIKFALNVLPNNLAQKILSKISGFADLPKEFAMKIIVDQKFITTVSQAHGEEQDKLITKQIELELTSRVNELTGRVAELEKQKGNIAQEKDKLTSESAQSLGSKDRQVRNLKTALFVISMILLLVLAYTFYVNWWSTSTLVLRLTVLLIGMISFLVISKLKWKLEHSYTFFGTTISIASVFFLLAYVDLPANNVPGSSGILTKSQTATSTIPISETDTTKNVPVNH